jgi:putative ABC transport system ATP-binding protein
LSNATTASAAAGRELQAAAVEASDLRMQYGAGSLRVDVLDLPRVHVATGERVGLAGPSGCGKSTLLNLCAGLLQPSSGRLRVNGVDVAGLAERERDRFRADTIGYVFQGFNLIPALSATENVMVAMGFGSRFPRQEFRQRSRALLERVGLGHRLDHRPAALSHGEMQRVGVARALANRPALLLADEPTASLEPGSAQAVVDLLVDVVRETGATLLLASHDERVLSRLDRVVQMPLENRIARQAASA